MNELLTEDRGAVRILTMNRPQKRNALNTALTRALLESLRAADVAESVACVLLTGAGQGFCAGADLSEFKDLVPGQQQRVEERAELTMQLQRRLAAPSKAAIAAGLGPNGVSFDDSLAGTIPPGTLLSPGT